MSRLIALLIVAGSPFLAVAEDSKTEKATCADDLLGVILSRDTHDLRIGAITRDHVAFKRVKQATVIELAQVGADGGTFVAPTAVTLNDRGEESRKKGDFDNAVQDYTEAIRLNSKFTWPYNNRGLAWTAKGEFEKAIKDFDEAIRLDPKYTFPFNNRGLVWVSKGDFDKAIKDYSSAIRLDPKYLFAINNRGMAWEAKGDFGKAIADYAEAIQVDPQYVPPYNAIAWIRATCHDPRYRAGKEAIEFATKACELTGWKSYAELDTLAAAYAEAGEFTTAVIWATTAAEKAPNNEKQDAESRLQLYRANEPYHQSPKK